MAVRRSGAQKTEIGVVPDIGRISVGCQRIIQVALVHATAQSFQLGGIALVDAGIHLGQIRGVGRIPHHRGIEYRLGHSILFKHTPHIQIAVVVHTVRTRFGHSLRHMIVVEELLHRGLGNHPVGPVGLAGHQHRANGQTDQTERQESLPHGSAKRFFISERMIHHRLIRLW